MDILNGGAPEPQAQSTSQDTPVKPPAAAREADGARPPAGTSAAARAGSDASERKNDAAANATTESSARANGEPNAGPPERKSDAMPAAVDALNASCAAAPAATATDAAAVADVASLPAVPGSTVSLAGLAAGTLESAAPAATQLGNAVSSAARGADSPGTTGNAPPQDVLAEVRALLAARTPAPAAATAATATDAAATDAAAAPAAATAIDATTTGSATADAAFLGASVSATDFALLPDDATTEATPGRARTAADARDEDTGDGVLSLLAAMPQSVQPQAREPAAPGGGGSDAPAASTATTGPAAGTTTGTGAGVLAQRVIEASLQLAVPSQPADASSSTATDAQAAGAAPDAAANALAAANPNAAVFDLRAAAALRHASGPTLPVHSPVGTQAWADEVGTNVRWMTDGGIQSASLRLNPDNLGPVEVRLSVQDGQTNVYFTAPHAETRAALEQALPRLRELLASQGLSLGDTGVSHQAPRERGRSPAPGLARVESLTRDEPIVNTVTTRGLGLVDLYA